MRWTRPLIRAVAVLALMASYPADAEPARVPFAEWLEELKAEARNRGITETTLRTAFAGVTPIARIVELDRQQPERRLSLRQYLDRVVTDWRIEEGRRRLGQNRELLERVSATFGVQPRFIVALWGIETSYGGFKGGYPVIAALTTLAYDGRRSAYFRRELLVALEIMEEGHVDAGDMEGSWAGAMGQSQFMPSSFVHYAYDFDGDGAKDIWHSEADVFASVANFLSNEGWRGDITWGREVRLPERFDHSLSSLKVVRRLSEWQALGVRRADGSDLPGRDLEASIVLPDGPNGPAYAVYDNYRTVLRWNRSLYFATAVGHLADRIAGG